jgi:hypothetical protein
LEISRGVHGRADSNAVRRSSSSFSLIPVIARSPNAPRACLSDCKAKTLLRQSCQAHAFDKLVSPLRVNKHGFALRLKLPAGYKIAPHTHPCIESVTVISGTFKLGMGEKADPAQGPGPATRQLFRFSARHGAFCINRCRDDRPNQHCRTLCQSQGRSASNAIILLSPAESAGPFPRDTS